VRQSTFGQILLAILLAAGTLSLFPASVDAASTNPKLGPLVRTAAGTAGWSRVIIRVADGASASTIEAEVERVGGRLGRRLPRLNARVAYVPNTALETLANVTAVARVSLDRPVVAVVDRTASAVGASLIREQLGYDGRGIGVAVIDSGITAWHDDLSDGGALRVARFVDFVNGATVAYDDYGHGTHVGGIIAGNGLDSSGLRTGIAPGVRLTVLKALDAHGGGRVSDVIAAFDYAIANKDALNIRIINVSLAAGVHESFDTDPLTLAAKRAVDAGIVVVAASGNFGRSSKGLTQYGGITSPANAPWVLTVGASSHMGTVGRGDDTIAAFSSRGPTAFDYLAKPDIVAPGVGTESLSDPASTLYTTRSAFLLPGTISTSYLPYLSLSGTSMAAPVVSGTVALMLQANPALTPNQVKAILQYTAQRAPHYDALSQGTGFLNAAGAIGLARHFAAPQDLAYPDGTEWVKQIIWANRRSAGGRLTATATAWSPGVAWGAASTPSGAPIEWGVRDDDDDGAAAWGLASSGNAPNVVWGTRCGRNNCAEAWLPGHVAATDDTVVWGTETGEETVVWGTTDGDTVVWGTADSDTVVWGTSADVEPVIWNR
jgi:serine protease AprX